MVNSEFIKDVSKAIKNSSAAGSKELTPGATGRRYEPKGGAKKHNERIHRESKQMDKHGNLPFTFSAPKKASSARASYVTCDNCGSHHNATENTIGIICKDCNTYSSVTRVE